MPTSEDYAAKKLTPITGDPEHHHPSKLGPKTEVGKKRSSVNALRHGLSGRTVVLPSEDMGLYLKFSKEFVDSPYPETPLERELAPTIADGYWRLKRVRTTEESLYALGHDEGQGATSTPTTKTSTPPTLPAKPSATTRKPSSISRSMSSAFREASRSR